jgi:polysaccharide export outer membrane protein
MKRLLHLGLVLLLIFAGETALRAQATGEKSPKPAATPGAQSAATMAAEDPNFVIGQNDVLDISVWKEPDISRRVPVRPDGKISLPLLNDIQAAGLTPMQLQTQISEKLKKFLTEPQVTVIVAEINSQRIYILGEANRPGAYPLLPNMTVLQALSGAGGLTQFANSRKVRILRMENGKQASYNFNYKEVILGKNIDQNIVLKPGDSIVVP